MSLRWIVTFFLTGQVLYELLGDGRAAVAASPRVKIVTNAPAVRYKSTPLLLPEALILDGDQRLFHVPRDLVIVDPDAVLLAGERGELSRHSPTEVPISMSSSTR